MTECNLDGWQLQDNGIFHKQGYSVVANNNTYTIIDPDSNTTTGDVLYPLLTAITEVNKLLEPYSEFKPFNPSLCDKIYEESGIKDIVIKLRNQNILTCVLCWEQGNGNNYYFFNEYFGIRVNIDNVIAYKFI